MVGFPNKPMGFPSKNDHFGVWRLGVPPFKETPISLHLSWTTKFDGLWVSQVMKVDNHIHLAAAMTPRMLLAFLGIEIMKHPCFEKGFSWAKKIIHFPSLR